MVEASIAASGERVTEKQPNRCAECGVTGTLVMDKPGHLSYEEKKVYRGEWYCNSHLPQFGEMPTKSFGPVL
jgi:hypothetical protein